MSKKTDSPQAFADHFAAVYGPRWPALRAALTIPAGKVKLENPFGRDAYELDEASVMAARALDLRPGMRMADLCASPGGKSLAAIFAVHGEGQWLCGDLSPARIQRLRAVLHDCLPESILPRVRVLPGDSSRWGLRFPEQFDRVLVDAPCSGERHLLAAPKELARWSLKSSQRLAIRQHALLCAGFDCLQSGGRLVYSTCTISPLENDGVIEKLHKSRAGRFEVVAGEGGEATRFGRLILPDVGGCGPIYFAVLRKI